MKILLVNGKILWVKDARDYEFWDGILHCFNGVNGRKRTNEIISISKQHYITWWYDNEAVDLLNVAAEHVRES